MLKVMLGLYYEGPRRVAKWVLDSGLQTAGSEQMLIGKLLLKVVGYNLGKVPKYFQLSKYQQLETLIKLIFGHLKATTAAVIRFLMVQIKFFARILSETVSNEMVVSIKSSHTALTYLASLPHIDLHSSLSVPFSPYLSLSLSFSLSVQLAELSCNKKTSWCNFCRK